MRRASINIDGNEFISHEEAATVYCDLLKSRIIAESIRRFSQDAIDDRINAYREQQDRRFDPNQLYLEATAEHGDDWDAIYVADPVNDDRVLKRLKCDSAVVVESELRLDEARQRQFQLQEEARQKREKEENEAKEERDRKASAEHVHRLTLQMIYEDTLFGFKRDFAHELE